MATLAVRQNILPIFGLNCHFGTVRGCQRYHAAMGAWAIIVVFCV